MVELPKPYVCLHDPQTLKGAPIGMYHCPDCSQMVMAGMEHPPLTCERCGEDEQSVYLTPDRRNLVCEKCFKALVSSDKPGEENQCLPHPSSSEG